MSNIAFLFLPLAFSSLPATFRVSLLSSLLSTFIDNVQSIPPNVGLLEKLTFSETTELAPRILPRKYYGKLTLDFQLLRSMMSTGQPRPDGVTGRSNAFEDLGPIRIFNHRDHAMDGIPHEHRETEHTSGLFWAHRGCPHGGTGLPRNFGRTWGNPCS